MKMVIATKNKHKADEFRQMLDMPNLAIVGLPDGLPDAPETGTTFIENAEQKAQFYARFVQDLVLADDSGLTVPALNGEPGVFSARYAGIHGDDEANNQKLITRLCELGVNTAPAYFVCALSVCREGRTLLNVEGRVEGAVFDHVIGQNGFGYDALFAPLGQNRRFAEMSMAEKANFSHRAVAVQMLKRQFGALTI